MFNKLANNKKGFVGAVVSLVIGLVVAVILMVGVLVPITQTTITNQSFTGVNLTIANNLITFILIGVLVLISSVALFALSKNQ